MEEIIYYDQDSSLGFKTDLDINGNREYRRNLVNIKSEFYTKNKDCFLVNGKWVRKSLLIFDEEKRQWVLKKDHNLIEGVVGIENKDVVKIGYFSPNPYKNTKVNTDRCGVLPCISVDLLIENGYTEDFSNGTWYYTTNAGVIRKLQTPRNSINNDNKAYEIEDNHLEFIQKTKYYNEFNPQMSKDVRYYGRMLGDSTFGVEFEAAAGYLPGHIQNQCGVIICKDGSLKDNNGYYAPEYVTIPMRGAKFLQTIRNLSTEIGKRNTIDIKCSLHLHIGNLPTTRNYLVTLFKLCVKLQNEIFLMFPYYKTNPKGIKNKNYNQKLPTLSILRANTAMKKEEFDNYINSSYRKIFTWLAEGINPDGKYNRKRKVHPISAKWDRTKRYFWMNLMNTMFSERNTVEFRLHTPTNNSQKIVNWIFICNAICKYAMNNTNKILTCSDRITMAEVLDHYKVKFPKRGEFLSEYLKAYVEERKAYFIDKYEKGDYVCKEEMEKDTEYLFTYGSVNHLF